MRARRGAALPSADESLWTTLARRRIRADYFRWTKKDADFDLGREYQQLVDAYDRAGLPVERVLVRLGQGRYLLSQDRHDETKSAANAALDIARRHRMPLLEADAAALWSGRDTGRP